MKNQNRVKAGKKAKRKGNSNERKIAKLFEEWWGAGSWARTPSSGGWATKETREDFRTCGDILTTAEDFPFCVELKKVENWTLDQLIHNDKCIIWSWWDQTVDETPDGLSPMLIFARNRVKPLVMLRVGDSNVSPEVLDESHLIFKNKRKGSFILLPFESMLSLSPELFGKKNEEHSTDV